MSKRECIHVFWQPDHLAVQHKCPDCSLSSGVVLQPSLIDVNGDRGRKRRAKRNRKFVSVIEEARRFMNSIVAEKLNIMPIDYNHVT